MMYMLVFSVLALVLVLMSIAGLSEVRESLLWEPVPSDADYGLTAQEPLFSVGVFYKETNGFRYIYDEDGEPVALVMDTRMLTESNRSAYNTYTFLMMMSIPFWIIFCLITASLLFYRSRLKRPIELLTSASAEIAQSNLDFHVQYDRRDEMGKLCESFERMRSALYANHAEMWRAMEERRRLNAAFSHDLRTPLTVLRGYTDLLAERLPQGTLPPERIGETTTAMSAQLTRLDRYVQSMQSMQRLEDAMITPTPVALGALAEELRATAEIVCEAGGKQLDFAAHIPSGTISVDPGVIMQVYENLLSNAARFAKSMVSVCLMAAGDTLSITVSDDGHGFSPEALQRAKDPYYSSGNTDGIHFGLGLNICDVLCNKHGGHLSVQNGLQGGASIEALFAEIPTTVEN